MLIAHITDSHIEIPEPDDAGRIADFEKVIDHINQLAVQPDLVIHTGDITHCDRPDEYHFTRTLLQRLHAPFEVIPGNKDRRNHMVAFFGAAEPFNQKVINAPDWQFLMLDTLSDNSNLGSYCSERRKWLRDMLKATQKPVALFMHHPSFHMAENPYPFQFEEQSVADEFEKLVGGFDNIKGIFCGHAHRNTKGKVASIPAMTMTSMSLDRRKGTYPPEWEGKPLYQLIDFSAEGSFNRHFQACD